MRGLLLELLAVVKTTRLLSFHPTPLITPQHTSFLIIVPLRLQMGARQPIQGILIALIKHWWNFGRVWYVWHKPQDLPLIRINWERSAFLELPILLNSRKLVQGFDLIWIRVTWQIWAWKSEEKWWGGWCWNFSIECPFWIPSQTICETFNASQYSVVMGYVREWHEISLSGLPPPWWYLPSPLDPIANNLSHPLVQ